MAADAKVKIVVELDGLNKPVEFPINFSTTTTPTKYVMGRQVQATADTDEVLETGDLSTVLLAVVECISNDVDLDCNYSSSFSEDITINEGEAAIFQPSGTIRLKNDDAGEAVTVDYLLIGT
jgi:hypothetical protein